MHERETIRQALLSPKRIALVGASSNPDKNTARPLRFMEKHGYGGELYPVNATSDVVLGHKAYPDLRSLPSPVDHVFMMIPGRHVEGMLEQCAAAGAKLVTVYSDGFAESGPEEVKAQDRLVEKARALGIRLLGPNSIGVANLHQGSIISVNAA